MLAIMPGCGKKQAPPPPKNRPELINDTLNVLKERQHEVALKKIERLRELEPTNVFLANLEILERNNAIIAEAQKEIDNFNLKKALAVINDGIKKYGRHKDLMKASKKLSVASKIEDILEKLKDPENSADLRAAALELEKISRKYKPAKPFNAVADRYLKLADKMEKWENQEAIAYFHSYVDECIDKKDPDLDVLFAIMEIEDPNSKSLLVYLDHLQGNNELPLKTYISEDEILRKQIALELKKEEEKSKTSNETSNENEKNNSSLNNNNKKKKGWWDKFVK
jgi:hypothetical protein